MSQIDTTPQSESGARTELPRVKVKYRGQRTLRWVCQNYTPGKDRTFNLEPGEEDLFDYDYARRIFGDWEVDPRESAEKRIEWNGMIAHIKRMSPSKDGKLVNVEIHDHEGNLLWDSAVQMEAWLEHNSASPETFAPPPGSPIQAEMPEVLEKASYKELKALWEKSWGSKMPAGMKAEVAKEALRPRMTAEEIKAELKEFYSTTKPPDMSQHRK